MHDCSNNAYFWKLGLTEAITRAMYIEFVYHHFVIKLCKIKHCQNQNHENISNNNDTHHIQNNITGEYNYPIKQTLLPTTKTKNWYTSKYGNMEILCLLFGWDQLKSWKIGLDQTEPKLIYIYKISILTDKMETCW